MEEEHTPKPFAFAIDAERTLPEILQAVMQLRASVDALAVFVIRTFASIEQEDPGEVAKRFEKIKEDFLLRHAFEIQKNAGMNSPQTENPSES